MIINCITHYQDLTYRRLSEVGSKKLKHAYRLEFIIHQGAGVG